MKLACRANKLMLIEMMMTMMIFAQSILRLTVDLLAVAGVKGESRFYLPREQLAP